MIVNLPPSLKLEEIADKGSFAAERTHLLVIRDCNLAYYLVMATVVLTPQTIAAGLRPAYWFVAQQAKEGDHIILYTREGKDSKEVRPDGHTNHFFYWSVKNAMFAGPGQVVVVELNAWFTGT